MGIFNNLETLSAPTNQSSTQYKKPNLIFNYGDNELDGEKLIMLSAQNSNNYVNYMKEQKGWKQDLINKFKEALGTVLDGILNKTIKANIDGSWSDLSGQIKNNGSDFDEYGEVSTFLNPIILFLYTNKQNKPVFNPSSSFDQYFINTKFGGISPSEQQIQAWRNLDYNQSTQNYGKNNRLNIIAGLVPEYINYLNNNEFNFEGTPYTSKEEYIQKLQQVIPILQSGNYDQSLMALSPLGIDLSKYLLDPQEQVSTGTNTTSDETTQTQTSSEINTEDLKTKLIQLNKDLNLLDKSDIENWANSNNISKPLKHYAFQLAGSNIKFSLIGQAKDNNGNLNYILKYKDDSGEKYCFIRPGSEYYKKITEAISSNNIEFKQYKPQQKTSTKKKGGNLILLKKGGLTDESKERIARNKIRQKDNELFHKHTMEKYKESQKNLREAQKEYNYWCKKALQLK